MYVIYKIIIQRNNYWLVKNIIFNVGILHRSTIKARRSGSQRWELLTFILFLVKIYTRMQMVLSSTRHPSSTDHGRLVCLFVCVVRTNCVMWNEIKYFIVKNITFNVYMNKINIYKQIRWFVYIHTFDWYWLGW